MLPPSAELLCRKECVVLLHGVGMHAFIMRRLETDLHRAGFHVENISYPSRRQPITAIAEDFLPAALRARQTAQFSRLHFVTHSMGSLVARLLFSGENRPANLGQTVMIGPPNHGSPAADHAQRHHFLRALVGVNLPALGIGPLSITRRLPPADFPVGVIAGNKKINLLFHRVLRDDNDGAVEISSARLEGMRDFLVVPFSHTAMLWRSEVIRQTLAFLRTGAFSHPPVGALR